jgi:hypothetical protein
MLETGPTDAPDTDSPPTTLEGLNTDTQDMPHGDSKLDGTGVLDTEMKLRKQRVRRKGDQHAQVAGAGTECI